MSIRRMQCSLFLLLLVLAPALGDGGLGLDGLVSTPGNETNYHVSALFTFEVWNSNVFLPETPEAFWSPAECHWRAEPEEHPGGGRL